MEYIAVATGPNQGLYTVKTKKQRNEIIRKNSGERIKCGQKKQIVEMWLMQQMLVTESKVATLPPVPTPTPQNVRVIAKKPEKEVNVFIAFKKQNKAVVYAYTSKPQYTKFIQQHPGWSYELFSTEKEAFKWTGCTHVGDYEYISTPKETKKVAEEKVTAIIPTEAKTEQKRDMEHEEDKKKEENALPLDTKVLDKSESMEIFNLEEIQPILEKVPNGLLEATEEDDMFSMSFGDDTQTLHINNRKKSKPSSTKKKTIESIEEKVFSDEFDIVSFTNEDLKAFEHEQEELLNMAQPGAISLPTVRVGDASRPFLQWYYESGGNMAAHGLFMGHVYSISPKGVVLTRVSVMFKDKRGETVIGKEDHIWLRDNAAIIASKAKEGANISFRAKVYAYKRQDGTLDYSLSDFSEVTKISTYFVPTELSLQKLYLDREVIRTYSPTDCQVIETLNSLKQMVISMKNKTKEVEQPKVRPVPISIVQENGKSKILYQCPNCNTTDIDMEKAKFCCGCGRELDNNGLMTYLPT